VRSTCGDGRDAESLVMDVSIVIINYRTAELTIGALESVYPEIADDPRCTAIVVDNASGDDSADRIARAVAERGWSDRIQLVRSPVNGGFSAGNNVGIRHQPASAYLLLNSDARLRPGTLAGLRDALRTRIECGLVGPRMCGAEGETQISAFRVRSPVTEFLAAAGTGMIDRLFRRHLVAPPAPVESTEAQWVTFACVLVRHEVIEEIGLLDEGYFMYFEDIDFCRRARKAGWSVRYEPSVSAVHLKGGSSSVKKSMAQRRRAPAYYFASRSRYFAKFYGGTAGLMVTNLLWLGGRAIAWLREVAGNKSPHVCLGEARDNWRNWLHPLRAPEMPAGGAT